MKRLRLTVITAAAPLLFANVVLAQVTLNSVRIGAKDTAAVAKFYQSAFGMQEVNRIDAPGGPEIFVNFGATVDAAKANKGGPVVIMHRDSDDVKDPIAHVIFNVKDAPVPQYRHCDRHRDRPRRQPHRDDSTALSNCRLTV